MATQYRTIDFLPEFFNTETNAEFLAATLDQLVSQPELIATQGFIGTKFGYGIKKTDNYVVEPSAQKTNYQLEPAVTFLNPGTQDARDFIDYPGIVEALKLNGALTAKNNRLFESDFYSWDGFFDIDKLVNFQQYYWLPDGPEAVSVTTTDGSKLNLNNILGKLTYTSPNGVVFTNGLKIIFDSNVLPAYYANTEYYVQGVGTAIALIKVDDMINWEVRDRSDTPDYIVSSRSSPDLNAWARNNKWFHVEVLRATLEYNNTIRAREDLNRSENRGRRPIIEFNSGLRLFNSGTKGYRAINFIDTTQKDAFSNVAGKTFYAPDTVNDQTYAPFLQNGDKILFAVDDDPTVRSTVYTVRFEELVVGSTPVITLSEDTDYVINDGVQLVANNGYYNRNRTFWYTEENQSWTLGQSKTELNQPPRFDVFDNVGISYSNQEFYYQSTFLGTTLFQYTPATGADDPVLGYPIKYSSLTNIGDIQFTVAFETDTFSYVASNGNTVDSTTRNGFVHQYSDRTNYQRRIGWVKIPRPTTQYQTYNFTYEDSLVFSCDVPAKPLSETIWKNVIVYANNVELDSTRFFVNVVDGETLVTLADNFDIVAGDPIVIQVISDESSRVAYYTVPSNLQNNPFNQSLDVVDFGDIRKQFTTIFTNAPGVTGTVYGENNVRDLGNLNRYGTTIVQHSASLLLPGTFLRNQNYNLADALNYNALEYEKYKQTIVTVTSRLAANLNPNETVTNEELLDLVINDIISTKTTSQSFFWGDMLYWGNPYKTNQYSFNTAFDLAVFPLDAIYDSTAANYSGVAVYLTRLVNGALLTSQLVRGRDYSFDTEIPQVIVTYGILPDDVITVKQYNQTWGSYCPNTPSKMGLYPAYVPEVISQQANPTSNRIDYIRGHDGSLIRLWGTYNQTTGQFSDIRDAILFEFELRVWNNTKTTGIVPLSQDVILPGQWRSTDFTYGELTDIGESEFLNWTGYNALDYRTQNYVDSDPFTYNYKNGFNRIDRTTIEQGYWRGIYRWLYDTDRPDIRPWEIIGYSNQPTWWTSRYGPVPVTRDNLVLWNDLAAGIDWNAGNPRIIEDRVRPGLLQALPVDSAGNLLNPAEICVSATEDYERDWVWGDGAPMENVWINSSSYAFSVMRLLSLTKPAKFYNLCVDVDRYRYSEEFDQYLYDNRGRLIPGNIEVYGNGTSKNSYLNWLIDWGYSRGADAYSEVNALLQNLDVRLVYRASGFTDKNYLKFYVERASVDSTNTSLLIPDESYQLLLYNNVPTDIIRYSSVIVQKTGNKWTVWGNDRANSYFIIARPINNGVVDYVNVGGRRRVSIPVNWSTNTSRVAYGTSFYIDELVYFLNAYGARLTLLGCQFANMENGEVVDWLNSSQRVVDWSQQSWADGTTISVNPAATKFEFNREDHVVQPLGIYGDNYILNENGQAISTSDIAVHRLDTLFSVESLIVEQTIAYTNLSVSSIEHAIVFKNTTVFGDIIYKPDTGLRQRRMNLQGYKSGDWNGTMNAAGFILNEHNVKEWSPNLKYTKGAIVLYKNNYWSAASVIEPNEIFQTDQWLASDYAEIKAGLLSNPSTQSYQSQYYYDIYRANLENDADLLAFSLIGYRPRPFLAENNLTDITQINLYKDYIKRKGTVDAVEGFKYARFNQGDINYDVYDYWAIKQADFGAVLSNNYIEFSLIESNITSNPSVITFTTDGSKDDYTQQSVNINSDLVNYMQQPTSANILPEYTGNLLTQRGLPTAGPVKFDQVKLNAYEFDELNSNTASVDTFYLGDNVWVAKEGISWQVYRADRTGSTIISVSNNYNGTATVIFDAPHNLSASSKLAIAEFDASVDGFYTVLSTADLMSVVVDIVLDQSVTTIEGSGIALRLDSVKLSEPTDIANLWNPDTGFSKQRVWIDTDVDGEWAVYQLDPNYKSNIDFTFDTANTGNLSGPIAVNPRGYWFATSNNVIYYNSDGTPGNALPDRTIAVAAATDLKIGNIVIVAANASIATAKTDGGASIANVTNVISSGSVAVSSDDNWIYVADNGNSNINVYYNSGNYDYTLVSNIAAANASALATSVDGSVLVVGQPNETVNSLTTAGQVSVFTQTGGSIGNINVSAVGGGYNANTVMVNITGDGSGASATANLYANGAIESISVTNRGLGYTYANVIITGSNSNTATATAANISNINFTLQQVITSPTPQQGALFGHSVDTNRWGADIIIGAPYELTTVNAQPGVEGSVYRFTNSGQRYGTANITITDSVANIVINDVFFSSANANVFASEVSNATGRAAPVIATANGNVVTLTVKSTGIVTPYNEIDLVIISNANLSFTPYTQTQKIVEPHNYTHAQFGYTVSVNNDDGLIIGSPVATKNVATTFDYSDDLISNDTIFDHGTTTFIDEFSDTGAVYFYDYLDRYNETLTNTGTYAFGQYINEQPRYSNMQLQTSTTSNWGKYLSVSGNIVTVSSPTYYANSQPRAVAFENSKRTSVWFDEVRPGQRVDVNKLNLISIYDRETNRNLSYLDYIDPAQNKLLGIVRENIDYIITVDPAGYGGSTVTWGKQQENKIWFNPQNVRLLNYNTDDEEYNATYWAQSYPGSSVDVYVWTENTVVPVDYSGPGEIYSISDYVETVQLDSETNSLISYYYYWIKNDTQIRPGKTLSTFDIAQYILDPISSGVPYLGALAPNRIAVYNVFDLIDADQSILHIGYNSGTSNDITHSNFKLLRDNHVSDFLPGIPTPRSPQPTSLYLKLLDSFSGVDSVGNQVPDPRLSPLARFGTNFRPRQTMFTDRTHALQNFVDRSNWIMAQYPLVESVSPTYFGKSGPGWNVRNYWELTDWWAPGYNSDTKPQSEVAVYAQLATLPQTVGYIARVAANTVSNSQTYVWTGSEWERIGLTLGTYRILPTLYTTLPGWDVADWDTTGWDQTLENEIRWIVRGVFEQILVGDLSRERNRLMTMLFEFIQSTSPNGTNYLPWLSKTSLIDVGHILRDLIPYTQYEADNFKLVADYMNEIKPYHVHIKGFRYRYLARDDYYGAVSDFDLPSQWQEDVRRFVSPQLVSTGPLGMDQYSADSSIWSESQYTAWRTLYGLSLDTLTEQRYVQVTELSQYISETDTIISVDNCNGMPIVGKIKIEDEIISYNNIDRYRGFLLDAVRGVDGTVAMEHYTDQPVTMRLPTVIVLDGASGYTQPPQVTVANLPLEATAPNFSAVIDEDGRVTAITVEDSGEGLLGIPQIDIAGVPNKLSRITQVSAQRRLLDGEITEITLVNGFFESGNSVFFRTPAVSITTVGTNNLVNNTVIEVSSVEGIVLNSTIYTQRTYFAEATTVIAVDSSVTPNTITISRPLLYTIPNNTELSIEAPPPNGLVNRQYYYIEEYLPSIYRLHTTQHSSLPTSADNLANPDYGKNLVAIIGSISSGNTLELRARAVALTKNSPVRELSTTLKYDRTSYRSKITTWQPNTFYAGIYVDLFKQASSSAASSIELPLNLSSSVTAATRGNPVVITLSTPSGFTTGIPVFIQNVEGMRQINNRFYFLRQISTNAFELYDDSELLEPTNGNNWDNYVSGGLAATDSMASSAQGLVLPLTRSSQTGFISYRYSNIVSPAQITGQAAEIYRYGLADSDYITTYYIQYDRIDSRDAQGNPTSIRMRLFEDASLSTPVTTPLIGALNMLIREPFYFDRSIVLFNGILYRCNRSNNDSVFDFTKWSVVQSSDKNINALDRITAFYRPGADTRGNTLEQLVDGITYPNNIYSGLEFDNRYDQIDINLMYSPTMPTQYDVVVTGDRFDSGYGPPELVPGIVNDYFGVTVNTTPGLLWNPNDVRLPETTPVTYLDSSGFNVVSYSVRPNSIDNYSISFDNLVSTPMNVALYLPVTNAAGTDLGQIKYHQITDANGRGGYRVDWVNKKIYITNDDYRNQTFDLVVYEVGGGSQLSRICSWNYPLQLDSNDASISYIKVSANLDEILKINDSYEVNGVYLGSLISIAELTTTGRLVTRIPHNLYTGDKIIITGTDTEADNTQYYVEVIDDETVQLWNTLAFNIAPSFTSSAEVGYFNFYKKLTPDVEYTLEREALSTTRINFNKPYDPENTFVSCVVLRRNFNVPISRDGYGVPERDIFLGNQGTISAQNNYELTGVIDSFDIRNIFDITTSLSDTDPVVVTTQGNHGLTDGQQISIFNVADVLGSDWNNLLNSKNFYVELLTSTTFRLYNDLDRIDPVVAEGNMYPPLNFTLGQWGQVYNSVATENNTIVEVNGIRLSDALRLTHVVDIGEPNIFGTPVPQTRIADLNDTLRISSGPAQDRFIAVGNNGTIITSDDVDLTPISATISGITQASPAEVTTGTNHGLTDGSRIVITDVVGMTEVNEQTYFINVTSDTTFELYYNSLLSESVDSSGYGAYVSGGNITLQSYSWTDRNSFTAASLTSIAQNDDRVVTVGLTGVIRYSNTSRQILAVVQGTPVGTPTVVNTNIAHNLNDSDPVAFVDAASTRYYVNVVTATQFQLFEDPLLTIPATASIASGSIIFTSFVGVNWVTNSENTLALLPIKIFDRKGNEVTEEFDTDLYSVKWISELDLFVAVGFRTLLESVEEIIDSVTYPPGIVWRVIDTDSTTANWNIPFLHQFPWNPSLNDDENLYDWATDVVYSEITPIVITDAVTVSGQTTITWSTGTLYTGDSISISDSDRELNGRYYLDVTSSTTADLYYDQGLTISVNISIGSTGNWGNVNKQFYLITTQAGPVLRLDRTEYNNGTEDTPYPMSYVYVPPAPQQLNKIVTISTGISSTIRWVLAGNNGIILTATEDNSWTFVASPSVLNLRYIATEDTQLTIVGDVGVTARVTAFLTGTSVGGFDYSNYGTNYQTAPTVSFVGGGGSGATATATIHTSGPNIGKLDTITITNGGTGYTTPPTVILSSPYGEVITSTDAVTFTRMADSGKVNLTSGIGFRTALAYEDASANARLMIMGELGTVDITSTTYDLTNNIWYNTRPFLQTIGTSLQVSVNGSARTYPNDWYYTITQGETYYDGTVFTISFTLQPSPGDIVNIVYVDPAYLPYTFLLNPATNKWSVTVNVRIDDEDVVEVTTFNKVSQQNLNTQVGLTGNFISRVANVVPTTANSAVIVNTLTADTTIEVDDEVIIYGVPGSSYNQVVKIVDSIANSNTAFTLRNTKDANVGLVNVVSNAVANFSIANSNAGSGYNPLTTTITVDAESLIPFAGTPIVNTIDGRIVELSVNTTGTGYDANSNLALLISGPNSGTAVAYANTDANGNIIDNTVVITNQGSGYNIYGDTTTITVISANVPATVANITPIILREGAITGINIISRGEGYDNVIANTANLVFNGANTSQASGTVTIETGLITSVQINDGGLGYTPNTNVSVTFTGSNTSTATANAVVGISGRITDIVITNTGNGYTSGSVTANVAALTPTDYENEDSLAANVALFTKNNLFELPLNIVTPTGLIDYNLNDIDRVWVWVNGYHLPYSEVPRDGGYSLIRSIDSTVVGTQLLINRPIASADDITILTMAEDSTPGETSFLIATEADGTSSIRRTNPYTKTWLTQPLELYDDVLYVSDVRRLIDTQTIYGVNFTEEDGAYVATVSGIDTTQILTVRLGRVSYSDLSYEIIGGGTIKITASLNSTINTTASVSVILGNTLKIGPELIGFTSYDPVTNSVTGLSRGINGTVTNVETVPTYTLVQSRLNRDIMSDQLANSNWYGNSGNTIVNTPLQLTDTPAADFINRDIR